MLIELAGRLCRVTGLLCSHPAAHPQFISYDDLITKKLESGRPKDIADIDQLNLIRDKESEQDTSLSDSE